MFINSIASAAELEVMKKWLKKTTDLTKTTKIKLCLPQFKSFFFESITLVSVPYIMKPSFSFDMSMIWIDIWNFQRNSKGKTLINCSFNFE